MSFHIDSATCHHSLPCSFLIFKTRDSNGTQITRLYELNEQLHGKHLIQCLKHRNLIIIIVIAIAVLLLLLLPVLVLLVITCKLYTFNPLFLSCIDLFYPKINTRSMFFFSPNPKNMVGYYGY